MQNLYKNRGRNSTFAISKGMSKLDMIMISKMGVETEKHV